MMARKSRERPERDTKQLNGCLAWMTISNYSMRQEAVGTILSPPCSAAVTHSRGVGSTVKFTAHEYATLVMQYSRHTNDWGHGPCTELTGIDAQPGLDGRRGIGGVPRLYQSLCKAVETCLTKTEAFHFQRDAKGHCLRIKHRLEQRTTNNEQLKYTTLR